MASGFYELLGVPPEADANAIRSAYQDQIAQVVRRLRGAEQRQQDLTPLEARRSALAEAYGVLSDEARRRRYDRFRSASASGFPTDIDDLWRVAGPSLVDPSAAAALEVLRVLTGLRVGDSIGTVEEVEVELEVTSPLAAGGSAAAHPPSTDPSHPAEPLRGAEPMRATEPLVRERGPRAASPALVIDRDVPVGELRRLFDVYGPTGTFLTAARELRRLDLEGLSQATKINRRFLEAIEAENFEGLPASAFVRGYLRTLTRLLELPVTEGEPDEVVEGYMARFHRARG